MAKGGHEVLYGEKTQNPLRRKENPKSIMAEKELEICHDEEKTQNPPR